MPSHTSNANPEKFDVLQERSGAHTSVCIRSFAARVIRANSVRVRLQINDRSADGSLTVRLHATTGTAGEAGTSSHALGALRKRTKHR